MILDFVAWLSVSVAVLFAILYFSGAFSVGERESALLANLLHPLTRE
jgi:hypothetical protein